MRQNQLKLKTVAKPQKQQIKIKPEPYKVHTSSGKGQQSYPCQPNILVILANLAIWGVIGFGIYAVIKWVI